MVDPTRFNDPVALVASWEPASNRSIKSIDAILRRNPDGTLGYAVSVEEVIKASVLILFGLLLIYGWLFTDTSLGRVLDEIFEASLISLVMGVVSAGGGAAWLLELCRPEVFDQRKGWYWRGWRTPHRSRKTRLGKHAFRLELIHAVQLLSKQVVIDDDEVMLHELNLVLHDGSRVSVRCHADDALLRSEATTIAKYLSVPVWRA